MYVVCKQQFYFVISVDLNKIHRQKKNAEYKSEKESLSLSWLANAHLLSLQTHLRLDLFIALRKYRFMYKLCVCSLISHPHSPLPVDFRNSVCQIYMRSGLPG